MRTRKNVIQVIYLILFTGSNLLFSQYDCSPPEDPHCIWRYSAKTINVLGCKWTYPFKYRICDNKLEAEYGEPQKIGDNCNVFTEFSYYQYDFKSKPDQFDLYSLIGESEFFFRLDVQDCPTTTEIVRYFKARCGVWVYCTYEIEPQTPDCQPGFQPLPDPNATVVSISKWQPCGFVCCQRKYLVCKKEILEVGTWVQAIDITRGKMPGSDCSGQVIYIESECLDGCY